MVRYVAATSRRDTTGIRSASVFKLVQVRTYFSYNIISYHITTNKYILNNNNILLTLLLLLEEEKQQRQQILVTSSPNIRKPMN
jgi:hypothetical protein